MANFWMRFARLLLCAGLVISAAYSQSSRADLQSQRLMQAMYHWDLWMLIQSIGWDEAFDPAVIPKYCVSRIDVAHYTGPSDAEESRREVDRAVIEFDTIGRPTRIAWYPAAGMAPTDWRIAYADVAGRVVGRQIQHANGHVISRFVYEYDKDDLLIAAEEELGSQVFPIASGLEFEYDRNRALRAIEVAYAKRIERYELTPWLTVAAVSRATLTWFGLCRTGFDTLELRAYDVSKRLEYVCLLPSGIFGLADYFQYVRNDGDDIARKVRVLRKWKKGDACSCIAAIPPCVELEVPERTYKYDERLLPVAAIGPSRGVRFSYAFGPCE